MIFHSISAKERGIIRCSVSNKRRKGRGTQTEILRRSCVLSMFGFFGAGWKEG